MKFKFYVWEHDDWKEVWGWPEGWNPMTGLVKTIRIAEDLDIFSTIRTPLSGGVIGIEQLLFVRILGAL